MNQQFVAKKNIDLVIDGLENFLQQMIRSQQFNAADMKNLMEPIFDRAGYRDLRHGGGPPSA